MCFGFAMKKGYKMCQGEENFNATFYSSLIIQRRAIGLALTIELNSVHHTSTFEIACCVSCQQVLGSKVNLLMMIFISYHH